MSYHRHHHNHHHNHHQSPPCCCCSNTYSCCSSNNNCFSSKSTPNHISSSSSSSSSDLLLQTLLLIQSQTQSQSQSQPHHPIFLKPQPSKNPRHRLHPQPKEHDDDDYADPSLHLLHSLIRRVASLESSLSKISPSLPQKQPQQRVQSSLKHAAAATIQRCFRRFLARQSRTLRDLKHLASIKSQAAALRSSLSDKTHLKKNPKALSHRTMDLLFNLDSIQSSDPMIREGKRSVCKELVRISEFVDKVLIREKEDEVEELERTIDRARRVSFAAEDNGDGDDNVFNDSLERNREEQEEEVQEFYVPLSDDGKESLNAFRRPDRFTNGCFRTSNGGLGLAAPLPVKMEPRRTVSLKKAAIEED